MTLVRTLFSLPLVSHLTVAVLHQHAFLPSPNVPTLLVSNLPPIPTAVLSLKFPTTFRGFPKRICDPNGGLGWVVPLPVFRSQQPVDANQERDHVHK
jgi:hypothetical protein